MFFTLIFRVIKPERRVDYDILSLDNTILPTNKNQTREP